MNFKLVSDSSSNVYTLSGANYTTGLCSFYAEAGGLMIGFEGGCNTNNNNNEH